MNYLEVHVEVKESELDPLTCILTDMGIAGFVVEDPRDVEELLHRKNDYEWDYVDESVLMQARQNPGVTFYLEDNPQGRETLQAVRQTLAAASRTLQPPQPEQSSSANQQEPSIPQSSSANQQEPSIPQPFSANQREQPIPQPSSANQREPSIPQSSSANQPEPFIPQPSSANQPEPLAWTLQVKRVCDEDWKDNWKAYFKPARITDRIVIKPTWEDYEKQRPDELIIELDPGMAFGTGTHPTTTLCIRLMERYLKPGRSTFLDVGCGSGILSIAAALLGAAAITAVDIDPEAVRISRENAAQNGLEQFIDVRLGDLTQGLSLTVDVVAANLMADLVTALSRDVSNHLSPEGVYISSGILVEKKTWVEEELVRQGFEILEAPQEGEWCAIAARRVK